jgi:WD40 repeat protein
MLGRWDAATGKSLYPDTSGLGHTGPVLAVVLLPDGKRAASAAWEETVTVRLWDVASGRVLHTLPGNGGHSRVRLRYTPDGRHLVGAGGDGLVRVWDADGKEVRRWPLWDRGDKVEWFVDDLQVVDGGRSVLTLVVRPREGPLYGRPGTVAVWDLATGERLLGRPGVRPLWNAAASPDGRRVVLESGEVLDVADGTRRRLVMPQTENPEGRPDYALTHDGALAARKVWKRITRDWVNGSRIVGLEVLEVATARPVAFLGVDEELESRFRLGFTPDGRRLLTIGGQTIRLWDVLSGKEVYRQAVAGDLPDPQDGPFGFSADGRLLITGHADSTVLVWELPPPGGESAPLTAEQRDRYWEDLADAPPRAYAALAELASRPAEALALLRERLRPVRAPAAADLRRWVADLDSAEFATREEAARRLGGFGLEVEAALRQALTQKPSLQVRKEIKRLLEALAVPRGDELRPMRAVVLLKRLGTAEARELLERLAQGDPAARPTREARIASHPLGR